MVDVRSEVFRLRSQQDPPLSYASIAQQLGISKSRVQRELQKTASRGSSSAEAGPVERSYRADPHLAADPDLIDRRKALEVERLETQRLEAQARRLEAETRIALLTNQAGGGNQQQMAAVLLQELGRMREELRRPASAAPPPPSLTQQLDQFRSLSDMFKTFAPATAASSKDDLEFKVLMEKVKLEEQGIQRRFEADMEERRERLASESRRNDAVATAIEQFAPLFAAWAAKQLEGPAASRPADLVVLPDPVRTTEPAQLPANAEVQGECPRCGAVLAMTPGGEDDQCPACGARLLVAGGAIGLRESGTPQVQTFAS